MVTCRFRSCPRCGGDTFIDRDVYGWYEHCLQCGYLRDLKSVVGLGQQQAYGGKEKGRRVRTLSEGKLPAMVDRVYILLDIVGGKAEW